MCCLHASEQPNLWLCFLMILNGQSSNTHPRGHSYQKGILLHRSHAAGLFKALLTDQPCCSRLPSGEPLCQRGHLHLSLSFPFSFPFLPVWHFTPIRAGQIYKELKDMAKLRLDVSLHGVNVGSYGTSLWWALLPGWLPWPAPWLSKAGDVLKCRNCREGCRKTWSP